MTIKSKINTKAFEENFGKINWSEEIVLESPVAGPKHKVCIACKGKGTIYLMGVTEDCHYCNGTGLGEIVE